MSGTSDMRPLAVMLGDLVRAGVSAQQATDQLRCALRSIAETGSSAASQRNIVHRAADGDQS